MASSAEHSAGAESLRPGTAESHADVARRLAGGLAAEHSSEVAGAPASSGREGIGVDVVDIDSFIEQLERPGTRFGDSFTARERRAAARRAAATGQHVGHHLAARWAAKEAFIKAWSAALYGQAPPLADVDMAEIEVVADAWQRPAIALHGAVAAAAGGLRISISMTHDGPIALAFAKVNEAL